MHQQEWARVGEWVPSLASKQHQELIKTRVTHYTDLFVRVLATKFSDID